MNKKKDICKYIWWITVMCIRFQWWGVKFGSFGSPVFTSRWWKEETKWNVEFARVREFNGRLWISDPLSKLRVIVSQLLRAVTPLSVAHPSRHSLGHDESENLRSSRGWPTACQESGCSVKPRPSHSANSHIMNHLRR